MKSISLISKLLIVSIFIGFTQLANANPAEAPAKLTGGLLVDNKGMTLYTFDNDKHHSGKSVCNGGCATIWPPLTAPANAKAIGDFTLITRDDGTKQWAYKTQPLYLYVADTKPGDATGDNAEKIWHVIKK